MLPKLSVEQTNKTGMINNMAAWDVLRFRQKLQEIQKKH